METDQVIAVRDNRQALQNALKAIGMPLKKVRTITSIDPALSKISSSELIPIFYESVDKVGEKLNLVSYQSKDACQEVQDWIPDVLCVLGGLKTIYNEVVSHLEGRKSMRKLSFLRDVKYRQHTLSEFEFHDLSVAITESRNVYSNLQHLHKKLRRTFVSQASLILRSFHDLRRKSLCKTQKRTISPFRVRLQLTLMLEAAEKVAVILQFMKCKVTELHSTGGESKDHVNKKDTAKAIEMDATPRILLELPGETAVLVELPGQGITLATIDEKPPIPQVTNTERWDDPPLLVETSSVQPNSVSQSNFFSFLRVIPTPSAYRSKRKALTEDILTFLKQDRSGSMTAVPVANDSEASSNHLQNSPDRVKYPSTKRGTVVDKEKPSDNRGIESQLPRRRAYFIETSPSEWKNDIFLGALGSTVISNTGTGFNFSISRLSPVSSLSSCSHGHTISPSDGHGTADSMAEPWKTWKSHFLHSLMTDVQSLMGGKSASCTSCTSSQDSPQCNTFSTEGSAGDSSTSPRPRKRLKRGLEPSNKEEEEEAEESDDDRERDKGKAKISIDTKSIKERKFACPYYQRNPELHSHYRSCAGPGWSSIHRLKAHLYRRHEKPISCPRCSKIFQSESELNIHQRLQQICEIVDRPPFLGFDGDQKRRLKSRKRSNLSEPEKWREVYTILFPDDDEAIIPSPYYINQTSLNSSPVQDDVLQYDRYLRDALPHRVRQRLRSRIEESLQRELVDIIRSIQEEMYSEFTGLDTVASSQDIPSTGTNEILHSIPTEPPAIETEQMMSTSQILETTQDTSSPEREILQRQHSEPPDMASNNPFMTTDSFSTFDAFHWNVNPLTPPASDEQISHNSSSSECGNGSQAEDIWSFVKSMDEYWSEHPN